MKKMFLILTLILSFSVSYSQNLIIHTKDGLNVPYPLDSIDSITFSINNILFQDNFENGISNYILPSGHTSPVLSEVISTSPTHSVTLPVPRSTFSIMSRNIDQLITSGIIGLECKFRKINISDRSPFAIYLFSTPASTFPAPQQIGIGFINDKVWLLNSNSNNTSQNKSISYATIQGDYWYKFSIEYDFSTQMSSFYVDDVKVYETPLTVTSFNSFSIGDGSSGGSPILDKVVFADDLKLYIR